jgi:hypothetical protein
LRASGSRARRSLARSLAQRITDREPEKQEDENKKMVVLSDLIP